VFKLKFGRCRQEGGAQRPLFYCTPLTHNRSTKTRVSGVTHVQLDTYAT
jgi:hypothetical protein